ncbi:ABC transporter permease [Rugosimonospora africana]|uniref:ABC transporter permease n=1 Tax=Rugosimonospora africana TaxID=556532 RepID=A0A8J3R338_9ACTN|nr:ABC transporter permease subunit [Rugosimonospora africana]GIH20783.1 ABC transporter permease [Rugosimonospora africana]
MTGAGKPFEGPARASTATGTDPARDPATTARRRVAVIPRPTGPDRPDPARQAGPPATVRRERRTVAAVFLAPALMILALLVAWPIARTVWLSLHDSAGQHWVGLRNYITIFSAADTRRALLNNAVWVAVAPTLVTVFGLIFAVLSQRVRLATVFRTILVMPMAVSLVSTGIAWRLVYDESPDRGVLNAAISVVHDVFRPASPYPGARPRDATVLSAAGHGGYASTHTFAVGTQVMLPLVGVARDTVPGGAVQAAAPGTTNGALSGVVWLDFTPGGGRVGAIDRGEQGLPGIRVQAVRDGRVVASATTDHAGRFTFTGLHGSGFTLALPASDFAAPFGGVSWLGPSLITPAIIVAYLWIWAGFAMLIISAGLGALPRETLEAARVDGASEWQVLRRVTIPLVRPVLIVVMVTLIINVLKIFDLVYVIAPDSSQDAATVVAVQMYKVSFGGSLDKGLGSALGVLLFVLVIPAIAFNVRRLRRDPS